MHSYNSQQEALHSPAGLFVSLKKFTAWGIDLLFPPRCSLCGRVDTVWCETCLQRLTDYPLDMATSSMPTFHVASTGKHEGILRDALHALKYLGGQHLAPILATRLLDTFTTYHWRADFITPVPMHPKRLAQRGYNQAERLATPLAHHLGIPCVMDALIRTRETISQVGLSAEERKHNVQDVFKAQSDQIRGKIGLVVDDVLTTGATIAGCVEALLAGGATQVYGITITRAI